MQKHLIFGTSQWGWTIPAAKAFKLLDAWLKAGYRQVDCATNYPLNKNPADFRAAEQLLAEYIRAHGLQDLAITMKIGSLDNMRSPEPNLAPSFLQMMAEEYHRTLGTNLDCLMIHWDNRDNLQDISSSLETLQKIQQDQGIRPGLSGIKHPEIYQNANQNLGLDFDIQLKHNVLQSDLPRYQALVSDGLHRFYAYGINAGGIKLDGHPYPAGSTFLARGGRPENSQDVVQRIQQMLPGFNAVPGRTSIHSMNQLGLVFAGLNPEIQGVLLGVSSEQQLTDSLAFWREISAGGFEDVYAGLPGV